MKMANTVQLHFWLSAPLTTQQFWMPLVQTVDKIHSDAALAQERSEVEQPERFAPIVIGGEVVDPRIDTKNTLSQLNNTFANSER